MKPRSKAIWFAPPMIMTLLLIAGCAASPVRSPFAISLPEKPPECIAGKLVALGKGDSMKAKFARRTAEAKQANDKIEACGKFYDDVKQKYEAAK